MTNAIARKSRSRSGIGQVELAVVLGVLAVLIIVAVVDLGRNASSDLASTAVGVGDPAQLANHSRLGGSGIAPQLPAPAQPGSGAGGNAGESNGGSTGGGGSGNANSNAGGNGNSNAGGNGNSNAGGNGNSNAGGNGNPGGGLLGQILGWLFGG